VRRRRWRRRLALLAALALAPWLAFHAADRAFPYPWAALDRYGASPVTTAADGTVMHVGLTRRAERLVPVTLDEVSPHLRHAAIASEDRRFREHDGVDLRAIARAAFDNVVEGRVVSGASTIPMQLARLAEPRPRTLASKLVEAFRALQLERGMTKDALLERYLNLVPLGGNLRGVGAAAHAWFGKRAADLTAAEAALLVAALPAPGTRAPDAPGARAYRDRVLARMHDEGFLDDDAFRRALGAPAAVRRTAFPDVAPHAWLRAGAGRTTIDVATQCSVEAIAARARTDGVDGLAIVVVENATRAVRALVGAPRASARVLDATVRPRSAGSTLKPFLFALAFDRGLAAPATRLLDLPFETSDWSPTDFDRRCRGPVRADVALADSLNLPALRLAAALPAGAFADALHRAGFRRVRAPTESSVDLALGTDDVTALELAGAYAALAGDGVLEEPRLAGPRRTGCVWCSPGAAALVTRALADPTRPRPAGAPARGVAWKTGTSSRRRDAWCAGYTRRYTVVVWRGRLDGAPHPDLVGARAAAPLFFQVLQSIDPDPLAWNEPAGTDTRPVCAESGLAAGTACTASIATLVPAGVVLRSCPVHHALLTDSQHVYCARCAPREGVSYASFAAYPPAWAAWRVRVGWHVAPIPPHDPRCPAPLEPVALVPAFGSPVPGQVFAATDGAADVPVRVIAQGSAAAVRLLLDGSPVGTNPLGSGRTTVRIGPGAHRLTAVDGTARHTTVEIAVRATD